MNESEPLTIVVERKGECPFYQEEAHFCTVMEDTCPDTKSGDCPLRCRDVLVVSVVNGNTDETSCM